MAAVGTWDFSYLKLHENIAILGLTILTISILDDEEIRAREDPKFAISGS